MSQDRRISQLPKLTESPPRNSEVIVNQKNGTEYVTKRVELSKLIGGGGEIQFFDPQRVIMNDATGISQFSKTYGYWENKAPLLNEFSSATQSIEVTEDATHAIVFWHCHNHYNWAGGQGSSTIPKNRRQYARHILNMTGAEQTGNSGDGRFAIRLLFTHNIAWENSYNPDPDPSQGNYDDRYSKLSKDRTKLITLTSNPSNGKKTVNFQSQVDLILGGVNKMTAYLGDLVVVPFKASAETAQFVAAFVNNGDDADFPNYNNSDANALKMTAKQQGDELRMDGKHLLDVISDVISDNAGNNYSAEDILTLNEVTATVNNILFRSTDRNGTLLTTPEAVSTALDFESSVASAVIAKPFKFETDAGIVPAEIRM